MVQGPRVIALAPRWRGRFMAILRQAALTRSPTPTLRLLATKAFPALAGAVTLVGLPVRPSAGRLPALVTAITRKWVRWVKGRFTPLQKTKTLPAFARQALICAAG